ncbi:hypothetical protein AB4371_22240 [Vibrio sp. 10N.261.51.A3]|uniref:hypothetical protein n=1 Tax=Vibrio TaxID=662 RepID=UPI000373992B|nr:hypothetical protein [Vibrio crassostreae]OEE88208.1 hypothetical protein A140_06940 [Vibrio crassostreae 9ZC88]
MINFDNENFKERLSTLTLPSEQFYNLVDEKYFNNNGGVYILRSFKQNGSTPSVIPRCLGNDSTGILYIGMAKEFTHRTGDLARAFDGKYKQKKHDCAVRYNSNKAWNVVYPKEDLIISFFISNEPRSLEEKFLTSYITQFGEVPPLNSHS